ncbi:MAG TPA: exo-alpha-sialidase [Verrucomicrobiota bacterium]|nr:exo-alpha-sialidase [Verrucomicrobiota bacterium]HRT08517.1 exo-alpha-sialidase [Candidatus Paceibacterota bacterium]HRT56741.1 exo-alpha-sialidase [Candidatus Paceibacterota bacterium]
MNTPAGALLFFSCAAACLAGAPEPAAARAAKPFLNSSLIFPLEHWHNHSSCVVECPNGDLLVCWYNGSGERTADDVRILGARKPRGARQWSAPFLLADTPGYPDTNPVLFLDPRKRLWLVWPVILANRWETALLKYQISSSYQKAGPPRWDTTGVLHVTPDTNFPAQVSAGLEALATRMAGPNRPPEFDRWLRENRDRAADKLWCRLGWMPRARPLLLEGKRLLLPLYSDGFDFSLVAYTDDGGQTWRTSAPIVGPGNVQPTLARKRDGTLVAYMRDNGPPPKRLQISQSFDRGETWSLAVDTDRLDPGAGVEVIMLRSGRWLLIHNDLEQGRHRLAVSLSDDEGATWKWTRYLEKDADVDIQAGPGSYHYPSILQARDGTLHATYSFRQEQSAVRPDSAGRPATESIKHAHFNEAWILEGDAAGR